MIDTRANMLKPVENHVDRYVHLWDRLNNPKLVELWHAMNTWVGDTILMAGRAYRQLINDFYKENRLMDGTLKIRDQRGDLNELTANL